MTADDFGGEMWLCANSRWTMGKMTRVLRSRHWRRRHNKICRRNVQLSGFRWHATAVRGMGRVTALYCCRSESATNITGAEKVRGQSLRCAIDWWRTAHAADCTRDERLRRNLSLVCRVVQNSKPPQPNYQWLVLNRGETCRRVLLVFRQTKASNKHYHVITWLYIFFATLFMMQYIVREPPQATMCPKYVSMIPEIPPSPVRRSLLDHPLYGCKMLLILIFSLF